MAPTARVSKVLARAGVCSRREAERWIADGLVRVNGAVIDQVVPVGPKDTIIARGEVVRNPQRTRVWLMHKLRKELVAKSDPKGRRTIYHRLEAMGLPEYVMPVGRLDFLTEGLLLLTNDGGFKAFMESPQSDVPRRYQARVHGPINESWLRSLRRGATIEGTRYKPIVANLLRRDGANAWLEVVLREGKNREVRNVLKHMNLTVNRLLRTDFGNYSLSGVPRGGVLEVPVKQGGVDGFRANAFWEMLDSDDEEAAGEGEAAD